MEQSAPAPRAGIKSSAFVALDQAKIEGDVTVGPLSIVSQGCSILAIDGPIVIGESNLIEERAEIINKAGPDGVGKGETMYIGNDNVFQIGSSSRALKVGDNNVFEIKRTAAHVHFSQRLNFTVYLRTSESSVWWKESRPSPRTPSSMINGERNAPGIAVKKLITVAGDEIQLKGLDQQLRNPMSLSSCAGKVGRGVEVTNGCVIVVKCVVEGKQTIPENTVIYGQECFRRVMCERPNINGERNAPGIAVKKLITVAGDEVPNVCQDDAAVFSLLPTLEMDFLRKVFSKDMKLKKPGSSSRRVVPSRPRTRGSAGEIPPTTAST
ncbi:unnamed protein product [Notodromas monacha]|uniref:Dynactin subunit 6 n=1 Tax=Notodromas monacha TaxID=399045 RepID=A0A7R9BLL3_9CRUS|nr:unnamed protein product [Notodromas monacha]CAG0917742.1 unnamed protein product [Notodromas monacha]